ncbi:MAG: Thymidylate synthase [Candidatus Uhrbacteria bacterium GW2011_GWD2_41_121]|uniref:thymidylate synthase n=1 Tax=Candidatus Uhrbacteria bacterium GW2011_GWC1_41_20 TaxID=1618983 RepID=A0A0G0VFT4_9BACT|nr:MAG: Thymidylate synthase [Candidatus Uhrbacteria bacterium GW2011_GWE1_39_46]KKR64244.1 MAG: Thymidylate synthase [Candidatus Uhrbacteria bacterium GW2011_GWC2_40_450]KKR90377.1 MAG: Thymidylate synthase [Candidatus Uhrbacteria bacterium GW2011_GWD2_41_121]KKR96280.1 MAG: Thymidylate synthase [Candidatus Uhrbacteria bacterium GW2011_GWD1_41_16]KKR99653.1 MAG: Thymidylate synthase [Candidatus Uhrbacteria bacterium GW2011_GWC1_41_20]KKS06238.1 MAG: Thymidylate synthase [Candidatus Uhrbacteri
MTTFDRVFRDAIAKIMFEGEEIFSERTGISTRAVPGLTYELYPAQGFPLLTLRKIPVQLFVSEAVWMITGDKNIAFMQRFTKIWDAFAEEDNTMECAYGYRWRHHFGRDQLIDLVEHLKIEPSSRQGVVMMWDPADDGLMAPKKKNVPCPFSFTVNIIGNKLNLHLIIRSNDMMLGNPHDTAGFALLQAMLAQELEVGVGKFTVSISHAHVYGNHYEQALTMLERMPHLHDEIKLELPPQSFRRALEKDVELVHEITALLSDQYKPMKALKKMEIAL